MKKLLIGFALVCFVAFGTLSVQTAVAADNHTEMVKMKLDNDPVKDKAPDGKDKKDNKDNKEKKATATKKGDCKDASSKCCEPKAGDCCTSKAATCGDKKEAPKKKSDDDKK